MYVIKIDATRDSGNTAYTVGGRTLGTDAGDNFVNHLPADNCTWNIVAVSTGGYRIASANFFPQNAAMEPTDAVSGVTVTRAFGYIGKTGRFVPITELDTNSVA